MGSSQSSITNEVDKFQHYLRITDVSVPAGAFNANSDIILTLACNGKRTETKSVVQNDGVISFRNKENKYLVRNSDECPLLAEFTNGTKSYRYYIDCINL